MYTLLTLIHANIKSTFWRLFNENTFRTFRVCKQDSQERENLFFTIIIIIKNITHPTVCFVLPWFHKNSEYFISIKKPPAWNSKSAFWSFKYFWYFSICSLMIRKHLSHYRSITILCKNRYVVFNNRLDRWNTCLLMTSLALRMNSLLCFFSFLSLSLCPVRKNIRWN